MAESKIEQLSNNVYYLPGGVNSVIVTSGSDAILLDTGQDKDAGRRIKKACAELNVRPKIILNTHAHADHYGGNAFLTNNFDVVVYGAPFESVIMQEPYLEPMYLYSGAAPPKELLSKWLLAKPSRVDETLIVGDLELLGVTLKLIDTSGHAHRHFSVQVDDVLFAADALFGESVLEKYPLPFGQNIAKQIESAIKLGLNDANLVLPGHGDVVEDITQLSAINVRFFETALETIYQELAAKPLTTEEILKATTDKLNIEMLDQARYYLNKCVVMAYLSYLKELDKVTVELQDNKLYWKVP